MGSWSPFHRDTAGWGGTCGHWMPAEQVDVSNKLSQPIRNGKLFKYIRISELLEKKNTTIAQQKCICTDGKVLWSGSQQLRATTPANWCWQVKAVYKDKAPPWKEWIQKREGLSFEDFQLQCYNAEIKGLTWEKPPRIIRWGGIPFLASCSIMAFTRCKQKHTHYWTLSENFVTKMLWNEARSWQKPAACSSLGKDVKYITQTSSNQHLCVARLINMWWRMKRMFW